MASLDAVRKLQKRTRDKEYRLRKQGAGQNKIDEVSPRKTWREVKAMTPAQLNSYARQLNTFNKKCSYVGSESGDVIPKAYISQAKKLIRAHNKFVQAETSRIQGIAPGLWTQYRSRQKGLLAHEESIGGLLTPIDVSKMTKPRSLAVAKRRVRNFEARSKHKFAFYRKIQKRNMITMLNTLGLYDLSEMVRTMKNSQFDVLSSVLPTWERLSPEYVDKSAAAQDAYEDIRSYVYKAAALNLKDERAAYVRYEKNRAVREQRGRKRAFSEM